MSILWLTWCDDLLCKIFCRCIAERVYCWRSQQHRKRGKRQSFRCIHYQKIEDLYVVNLVDAQVNNGLISFLWTVKLNLFFVVFQQAVESVIGGSAYQHNKVNQWTSSVVELCLNQLAKLNKPFKYIVTCVIMQKNGAGLHTASSCYWDNNTDGMHSFNVSDCLRKIVILI